VNRLWLDGRHALVVGTGDAVEAVVTALAERGAAVTRTGPEPIDASEIAAVFEAAEGDGFDILVHAGTKLAPALAESIDLPAWRSGLSADLDGRFLFAAEFTRRRLAASGGGSILFLMPSAASGAGRTATAAAHGALENLVKSLAVEWARDGIRINAIASRVVEDFASASPAQRASLGHLAAYLASDYAAYATGAVSGIDEI